MGIELSKLKATLDEYNEFAHSSLSKVTVHFVSQNLELNRTFVRMFCRDS